MSSAKSIRHVPEVFIQGLFSGAKAILLDEWPFRGVCNVFYRVFHGGIGHLPQVSVPRTALWIFAA